MRTADEIAKDITEQWAAILTYGSGEISRSLLAEAFEAGLIELECPGFEVHRVTEWMEEAEKVIVESLKA